MLNSIELSICLLYLQGGLSSGYKKFVADKGLTDETYTAESIALIRISGTSVHNNKAVQVDAVSAPSNRIIMMWLTLLVMM